MAVAIGRICDPAMFRLNEAIQQAQNSGRACPGFEIDLARFLLAQCLSPWVPLPTVFRGLDVLGGLMDSGVLDETRLTALLKPFLSSNDPRIAAKSVLVLERQPRKISWLNRIVGETDDRIRANMIESLWTRKELEVEPFLRSALNDRHQRVAANAVYGLYLSGSKAWVEGLDRLLGSEDAAFLQSGIWVLRSSGVPDAPSRLQLLIRATDPTVRRAAFGALIFLRERRDKKNPRTPA